MAQELRQIPGYPHYLIGNDGTVWTLKRKGGNDRGAGRLGPPRLMRPHRRGKGYITIALDLGGRVVMCQVHRLVLLAFKGEPPLGTIHGCHFPDTDPGNNNVENLRWDTPSENAKDKYRHLWTLPTKTCTTCGIAKEKTDFYVDKRNVDGRKAQCKPCHCRTGIATTDPVKKRARNREFMRKARLAGKPYTI